MTRTTRSRGRIAGAVMLGIAVTIAPAAAMADNPNAVAGSSTWFGQAAKVIAGASAFDATYGFRNGVSVDAGPAFDTSRAFAVYPGMPEVQRRIINPPTSLVYGILFNYSSSPGVADEQVQAQIRVMNEDPAFHGLLVGVRDQLNPNGPMLSIGVGPNS